MKHRGYICHPFVKSRGPFCAGGVDGWVVVVSLAPTPNFLFKPDIIHVEIWIDIKGRYPDCSCQVPVVTCLIFWWVDPDNLYTQKKCIVGEA